MDNSENLSDFIDLQLYNLVDKRKKTRNLVERWHLQTKIKRIKQFRSELRSLVRSTLDLEPINP